jgi:hypothetical protein
MSPLLSVINIYNLNQGKMKNAIKYGIIIGVLSGIWLFVMHMSGVYTVEYLRTQRIHWMELASVIIPFLGLYLGIKNFRDNLNGGKMEFFEGLFQGFMILLVGGLITSFIGIVYIQNVTYLKETDYMGRIGGAGVVGILLNLVVSLLLMNKQHDL